MTGERNTASVVFFVSYSTASGWPRPNLGSGAKSLLKAQFRVNSNGLIEGNDEYLR